MPGHRPAEDGSPVELTIDTDELAQFGRILAQQADPKRLRRELAKEMRQALQPAVQTARSSSNAMGHDSRAHPSPALRPTIARGIRAEVRLTGRSTGARVKVKKTPGLRGFSNAARNTNLPNWRHPVGGNTEVWVDQVGKPGWFDRPMNANQSSYRAAVMRVVEAWAARIARKG